MSNATQEVLEIEITPEDEVTLVDSKWATANGYGSTSTINRNVEKKEYPQPITEHGEKKKWTLAQWKRYLQKKMDRLNHAAA